jgi:alcohol dehydrogenase, propanol-preferring
VRAAVLEALPARGLTVLEVTGREPASGEILLDVEACGICGTDLHILAGESYRPELPFVLGHEPVGLVRALGEGVDAEWLGRRVTMTLFEGCGRCGWCARGDERLCPDLVAVFGVFARWGGFAEELVVPVSRAVAVPPALSSVEASVLVDAGATAANAAEAVRSHDASTVLLVGGGPVGLLVAELLAARGIPVTVVEPLEPRRNVLDEFGHAVVSGIEQVAGPFDAVVDCAGAPSAVGPGLDRVAPRGLFVVVGYTEVPALDLAVVARRELRVHGIRSGSRLHLEEVLRAAAEGEIRLPPVSTWTLDHVNDALTALREGRVAGKAVIEITPPEEERWTS